MKYADFTVGEDHLQRSAFKMRFSEICALTGKGFSFQQIAELLEQGGLKLHWMVVRQYYTEHMVEKMEKCVQDTNVQIDAFLQRLSEVGNDSVVTEKVAPAPKSSVQHAADVLPLERLHCLALLPIKPLERRDGVSEEVYMDGQLEHPAIPGLMLSKNERLYGTYLEIVDNNGKTQLETVHEKIFRIKWQKPIPRTHTATSTDFVQMDYSLFENVGTGKVVDH